MSKDSKKKQGKINIKNKTPLFTRNNFYILMIIIVTAIVTGMITTKYVTSKVHNVVDSAIDSVKSDNITDNIIKTVGPSLVTIGSSQEELNQIEVNDTNTTGVVIGREGLVITNYDLIKNMKNIYVKLPAKGVKPEKAVFLGEDKETGIAVLKISNKNLTPIQYAKSLDTKTGDTVVAIGNATSSNYVGMITPGVVTSTSYSVKVDGDRYSLIQTNAVMNSQNYGGVLCNALGQMVGFNSYSITKKYDLSGLHFALGTEAVINSVQKVLDSSNVLGIEGAEVGNGSGFYVSNVEEGTPASKAGVKATDIIVSIDGNSVNTLDDFYSVMKQLKKGQHISVDVLKDGKSKEVNIIV